MQPYRLTRPHNPAECGACAKPAMAPGAGHMQCQHDGCDLLAEIQYRRHATAQEYEAIGEGLRPIDGVAHAAVFVCADHEPDPVCGDEHQQPPAAGHPLQVPCPVCEQPQGSPCVKPGGSTRSLFHTARGVDPDSAPVAATACTHVHREDCGGLGSCLCRPDDAPPPRTARLVPVP